MKTFLIAILGLMLSASVMTAQASGVDCAWGDGIWVHEKNCTVGELSAAERKELGYFIDGEFDYGFAETCVRCEDLKTSEEVKEICILRAKINGGVYKNPTTCDGESPRFFESDFSYDESESNFISDNCPTCGQETGAKKVDYYPTNRHGLGDYD